MTFREKAATIATPRRMGTTRDHVVLDETTGKPAGKHIEHWDGRQDAVVSIQGPADRRHVRMGLVRKEAE